MGKRRKNLTRRDFLKYSGKIGVGAAVGGTMGNIFGRVYRAGRDFYNEEINPYLESVGNAAEKIENGTKRFRERFYGTLERLYGKPYKSEDTTKEEKTRRYNQPEEKISRRSLLSFPFRVFHRYPVSTGTAVGASAFGAITALKSRRSYVQEKRHLDTSHSIEEVKGKLDDLSSKLEKLLSEKGIKLMLVGLTGIIYSIILSSFKITGFLVLDTFTKFNYLANSIMLIFFLVIFSIGFYIRKSK